MNVRKYQFWSRGEISCGAGVTQQFNVASFEAPEDGVVVGILVEGDFGPESASTTWGLAGYARLVVNRAGNTVPTIVPDADFTGTTADWDAVGGAATLNDADSGDTWAITPLNLGPVGKTKILLAPKTKRKLRRQDVLSLEVQWSNAGSATAVANTSFIGTLFYGT